MKENMKKRSLSINDAKTETSGDNAAEEWSTPVNWEEDHGLMLRQNGEEE